MPDDYTDATTFEVEGARVGIVICETCGAAILLDPRDETDRPKQHAEWHRSTRRDPRLAFIGG